MVPVKIPLCGGDEEDVISRRSRRMLTSTKRPGVCRAPKRSYSRRLRKVARVALAGARGDD
jgi:hypothetical protein